MSQQEALLTLNTTSFAQDTLSAVLSALEELLDAPLPIQKLDIVILPSSLPKSTVPASGLVVGYQADLCFDSGFHPPSRLLHIARFVVTSVLDQVFSLAVSPNPTTSTSWLGPGILAWLADTLIHRLFPRWRVDALLSSSRMASLSSPLGRILSLSSGLPAALADRTLGVSKMAGLMAMVAAWIGPQDRTTFFQTWASASLRSPIGYSDKDILAALDDVSSKPVSTVLAPWLDNPSCPVVSVTPLPAAPVGLESEWLELEVSQSPSGFWVPLFLMQAGASRVRVKVFADGNVSLSVHTGSWLAVNWARSGLYHVLYSGPLASTMIAAAVAHILPPPVRASLVGDAAHGVLRSMCSLDEYLDIVAAIMTDDEDDVGVWWEFVTSYLSLEADFALWARLDDHDRKTLRTSVASPLRSALRFVGWDRVPSESLTLSLLRPKVVSALGLYVRDSDVIAEALARFGAGTTSSSSSILSASDLAVPLGSIAVRESGKHAFECVLEMTRRLGPTRASVSMLGALSLGTSPSLVSRALDYALQATTPASAMAAILSSASQFEPARSLLWPFVTEHLGELYSRFNTQHQLPLWYQLVAQIVTSRVHLLHPPPPPPPSARHVNGSNRVDATVENDGDGDEDEEERHDRALRSVLIDALPGSSSFVDALADAVQP